MADFSTAALRTALDRASEDLKRRVGDEAGRAANALSGLLNSVYPSRTGRLVRGISVRALPGFGYLVRSGSPIAEIYDKGTVERFDSTRKNARRGRSPRHNVFVPQAIRQRQSYLQRAQSILNENKQLV